ncbi:MFS transporter [Methylobacterium brachiatum]|jgi:MFS family permease|uniref:MFS family permease n=1 Tax=Methylobacterium brachiatum TaxID=269660 RepID=A0AAJ1TRM5_9HYPH|nr:MFS transporter [Methylobacterium brachiatum]AYO81961.1 MFS transporter [Methylobacterium brachiatum]MCB4804543.1 MFS transporter [Methylobacterium brachiatum]MDF2597744.1 phthalate transporter [Methylobacterium brachiatum]MDQ0545576.1 MFS family permease [Methylobacterium brachiatum]CAA2158648.1 Putative tartrate transporter [Methylobacterium brachiatum]
MPPTQPLVSEEFAESTVRTVTLRLMPLLGLLYLIAYIDRQNVSYAKLDMVGSLGLSETAYGLGASLFFLGYFLFEVPANVFLERVGARVWFARIMFTWGIVTILLGFTQNAAMFYVLRFLLGAAEAGFFPGVLFALTLWFPQAHRARMIGWFMIASAVANAVGAAIGGALLGLDGVLGLAGWQWVFLATGAPAILMTAVVLLILPNGPETAPWLSQDQRAWLAQTLRAERESGGLVDHGNPFAALLDKRVLMLAGVYVSLPLAAYGLGYWLPTVVKGFGVSNLTNGFLNIIPWAATAVALWWVPRHAARTGAQGNALTWHVVGPALVGATGLALSVILPGNAVKFACLCVAAAGTFSAQPVFWSMPATFLRGATAAAGIAAINSVGNLGGFVAQNMVPFIRDQTQSDLVPMLFLSACLAIGAGLMFIVLSALRRDAAKRAAASPAPRTA